MCFSGDMEKKKHNYKFGDEIIHNIPAQIAVTILGKNMKCNENKGLKIIPDVKVEKAIMNPYVDLPIEQITNETPDVRVKDSIVNPIMDMCKEQTTNIIPEVRVKNSIVNPSMDLRIEQSTKIIPNVKCSIINPSVDLHIEPAETQPVVLLCVNMVQNGEVIFISAGNTTKFNMNTYPEVSPETNVYINQLLQSIEIMCKSNKQRLSQQAITQGNSTSAQNSCRQPPKIYELPLASYSESVPSHNYEIRTSHTHTTHLEASDNLCRHISSEYEMTRCFFIYNQIFTEFLKTFAVMYCTLTNKFLMKHKNMPRLCSHNWYFRNFTQGYVLKCVLKNGQVNALNVMMNLYYIIITKCTSGTKIDIFFNLEDGILSVYNDNQECRFTQHILLNRESMDEMDKMSSLHTRKACRHVSHGEQINTQTESDESNSTISSCLSLPQYPSQSTFFEEEINSWHQSIEVPEKECIDYSDVLKHDLNEMYVSMWCGIHEFTESLRNISCSTHEIVYNQFCSSAGVLGKLDIFNEELFEMMSFDNIIKHSTKHFNWDNIYKPLLQTLAYTLFSYVL